MSAHSVFTGVLGPPSAPHSRLPGAVSGVSEHVLRWPVIDTLRRAHLMLPGDFDGAVLLIADAAAEHTYDVWSTLDALWKHSAGLCKYDGVEMPSTWNEKAKKRNGGGLFAAPPSSVAAAGDRTFVTQKQGNIWHKTHILLSRLDSAESLCAVLTLLWYEVVIGQSIPHANKLNIHVEKAIHRLVVWDAAANIYKCATTKVAAYVGYGKSLRDGRTLSEIRKARAAVEALVVYMQATETDHADAAINRHLVEAYTNACVQVTGYVFDISLERLKRTFEVQGPSIGMPADARLHVSARKAALLLGADGRARIAHIRIERCPAIAAPVGSLAALRDAFQAVDDRLLDARARVALMTGKGIGTTELKLKLLRENIVSELFGGLVMPSCIVVYARTSRCLEVHLIKNNKKNSTHPVLVRVRPCGTPICPSIFPFELEAAGVELLCRMQAGGDGLSGLFRRVGAITRECAMCGKTLKTEDSVQFGVGPECLQRLQEPSNIPGVINNEDVLALARLPTDGVDSHDLRRPTGRDVAQRAAAMTPSASPQVQLIRLAMELKQADGESGVFAGMQETLAEDGMDETTAATVALARVCTLVGIPEPPDSDVVRTACIDLVHMHRTGMVPGYRNVDGIGYDDHRLLTATLLADPLGMLQPIANWLKWCWTTDPMWSLPPPTTS